MRSVRYTAAGAPWLTLPGPDVVAGRDEVVVDMEFAALNPLDLTVWRGTSGLKAPPDHVPGIEGAGRLDGQPVVVFGQGIGIRRPGTCAERVAVPKACLFPVPAGLSLEQAAACGAGGATAWRLFELVGAQPNDLVLIHAAAGNIGSMLASLLASAGVAVIGQTRSATRTDNIRGAGAQPIVAPDPAALPSALSGRVPTVVVDSLGGPWLAAAVNLLPVSGRIVSFGSMTGAASLDVLTFYRKCLSMRGYSGLGEPAEHARSIGRAMAAAVAGSLKIERLLARFGVDQVSEALRDLESGRPAKILVDLRALQGG